MNDIKGCPTATHALEIIINDIYEVDKNTTNITILGRYSEDINSIIDDSNHFTKGDYENGSMPITYKNGDINMKINFMTIHKAKGLEFDNVVLFIN